MKTMLAHTSAHILKTPLLAAGALVLFAFVLFPSPAQAEQATGIQIIEGILNELNNLGSATTTSVAAGFSRDGVYGCTGAAYGSVGMQGPGGSHVPVFDDAVHDQERLLTYKECLLDGIVNSMRETLISFIIQSIVRWTNEGFDGNPAFISNLPLHLLERISDPVAEQILTGPASQAIAEPFRRDVQVMLAKNYANTTRRPENALRCGVSSENIISFSNNESGGDDRAGALFEYITNPSCNPLFAGLGAQNYLYETISAEQQRELTQLEWGSGFRSVESEREIDLGGGQSVSVNRIVTPGFMIAEHLRQLIGTGLRQSENADEIDEIISALMSNIGTEMLTDQEGLSGLSRSFGGRAPYVDRIAADSAARTRSNMTGAAQQTIDNTIRVEQEYIAARERAARILTQTEAQLTSWENTCWASIIDAARAGVAADAEAAACQAQGSTSTTCGISVSVTEETSGDALSVSLVRPGVIRVSGRASKSDSTIALSVEGGLQSTPTPPLSPTVLTSGEWTSAEIDLSGMPNGSLTVVAVETESSGSTHAPVTSTIQKETTPSGIVLTLPSSTQAVTITATAGGISKSVTVRPNTTRSTAIVNANIKPLLDLVREHIRRGGKALEVVAQIRQALASTTSASAQRFLLEKIDQLVAARALHTEAQLRQAEGQADEIDAAMQQLLEETKENWEATWCDPDNWRQYVS
ncbi:MAG: hypothetical protein Q8P16_02335 [bacterium]|nr:hypothetical protein [bacterium]